MRKRLLAIIATVAMVVAMMPSMVFGATTYTSAQFLGLEDGSGVITLTDDVELSETVALNFENLVIDGKGHTITTNETKAFEVFKNVTFKNVTIKNTAAQGRCVDTRVGDIIVNLENVTLEAMGATNTQPLTIGGSNPNVTVNIKNSKINALNAGYATIVFVPAKINIDNSNLTGFSCLYFKAGSDASVVTVKNSTLRGENNHSPASGMFGTIVVEKVNDVKVSIEKSKVEAYAGDENATQMIFLPSDGNATSGALPAGNELSIDKDSEVVVEGSSAKLTDDDDTANSLELAVGTKVNVPVDGKYLPTNAAVENGVVVDKTPVANDGAEGEKAPVPAAKPEKSPNTGDNRVAPFAVAGLVLAAMAAAAVARRRYN